MGTVTLGKQVVDAQFRQPFGRGYAVRVHPISSYHIRRAA